MAANTHMSAAIVADQTMAATVVGPNGVQMRQIATLTLSPLQTREAHTPYPQQMESPMIHHLSYPRNSGCSVNEHISKELTSVAYAGIQMQFHTLKS